MGMNILENLQETLERGDNEIIVDPAIAAQALLPLDRMVNFANSNELRVKGKS